VIELLQTIKAPTDKWRRTPTRLEHMFD
jgi:hypothetical protein